MKNPLHLLFSTLLLMLICNASYSQKIINALKIAEPITIDGQLNEAAWENAEATNGFKTWQPSPGLTPDKDAEIKLLYDNEALYIGVFIEEVSRDSIMQQLTQRDELGNTDWFGFFLDTYQSNNNALEFIVGATGVQFDAKLVENQNEDTDWDAVWFSEVNLTDEGWFIEFQIPYSAIRFPKKDVQHWNINFIKYQARTGEKSTWNAIDPTGAFFLTQSGSIEGIKDIKPPVRLSFSPYVSAYFQRNKDQDANPIKSSGYSYNGGMDLKYGINDAFTLDMTLIPDFGQVQSDDNIVNLSPFEVRFNENRPFFTEGIEIFNKGNLFYSRRVGGTPMRMYEVADNLGESEEIINNPSETQLYNATKISGRAKNGLAVGFFNAVAGETHATIHNYETDENRQFMTAPLTNYNVFILDQNLKNNSTLSLTNTSVIRQGADYYDANVTAATFDIKNKKQSYGVYGDYALSQKFYNDQDTDQGYRYNIGVEKLTGNLNYGAYHEAKSKSFDSNDLGFNRSSNNHEYGLWANYSIYEEFWNKFNRANFWFNYTQIHLHDPRVYTSSFINFGFWTQDKNFRQYNMWFNIIPKNDDYFEPRTDGYFVDVPLNYNAGLYLSTDNRKKFRIGGSLFGFNVAEKDRYGYGIRINPRYRFNDKFTVQLSTYIEQYLNSNGWVDFGENDEPIFGKRNRENITNVLSADYTLSDKMGLTFRLRHYWIKVLYNEYYGLDDNGQFINTDYSEDQSFNFDLFNIDLNYRWRFAPGSDLFLVWKNNIAGSYLQSDTTLDDINYLKGVKGLNQLPQENSFSVRVVYYVDYLNIQKKLTRNPRANQ